MATCMKHLGPVPLGRNRGIQQRQPESRHVYVTFTVSATEMGWKTDFSPQNDYLLHGVSNAVLHAPVTHDCQLASYPESSLADSLRSFPLSHL